MFTSQMPAVKRTAQGCLANQGKQQQRAQKLTTHPQPPAPTHTLPPFFHGPAALQVGEDPLPAASPRQLSGARCLACCNNNYPQLFL